MSALDWRRQITGKHGHAMTDGAGYLLYMTAAEATGDDGIDRDPSPRPWKTAKAILAFAG